MTNAEFGRRIGVHFTTASRMRRGQRRPSVAVMLKIGTEFGIPDNELMRAHVKGASHFARLLRRYTK